MFKKRMSHLITYESGGSSSQIDYFLISKSDRKWVRDVKIIPGEECIPQHKLLVCNMCLGRIPVRKKVYLPKRKVWLLENEEYRGRFHNEMMEIERRMGVRPDVDNKWNFIECSLLDTTDKVCGKTKGPPRHKFSWWGNNDVEAAVREKKRCFKVWKEGGSKEEYLSAKRNARREVGKILCSGSHRILFAY